MSTPANSRAFPAHLALLRAFRRIDVTSSKRLGWLLALFTLSACSSQPPLEKTAEGYWRALQTGELGRAYAYLSSGDQEVISAAAFSSRMRFELYPHLFFSQYDGAHVEVVVDSEAARESAAAFTEVSEVVRAETYAAATARLVAPNYRTLGQTFTHALERGTPLGVVQEQRLIRALSKLRKPPLTETRHRFRLIQEEGAWRVTYPLWRAEASLKRAETLAAEGALEEAQALLINVGRFAVNLDGEARAALTRAASRGRRMLPHLASVQLTNFTLSESEACKARASLRLRNRTFDLRTAAVVVNFEMRGDAHVQRFVLGKADAPIAEGESAYFELCLEPPPGWQGRATAKITWLDFTDEVYKSRL